MFQFIPQSKKTLPVIYSSIQSKINRQTILDWESIVYPIGVKDQAQGYAEGWKPFLVDNDIYMRIIDKALDIIYIHNILYINLL